MTELDAMKARHSVRKYTPQVMSAVTAAQLQHEIDICNETYGTNIQLVLEDPDAFGGILAHYGMFSGVRSYIALVGKKGPELDETLGYCGEKLVIKAQMLGLNTCWVGGTYSKRKCDVQIGENEKLVCVITVGYGETQGKPHKSKPMESRYQAEEPVPVWFIRGMEAVMLAPTAVNQQKFRFTLSGTNTVKAESTGGFYSKVDLGIVKYHFEIGAGKDNFQWQS